MSSWAASFVHGSGTGRFLVGTDDDVADDDDDEDDDDDDEDDNGVGTTGIGMMLASITPGIFFLWLFLWLFLAGGGSVRSCTGSGPGSVLLT
jgi:hypothetical protein